MTPRGMLTRLVALAALLAAAEPAVACDKMMIPDHFTTFDRATTVAIVRAEPVVLTGKQKKVQQAAHPGHVYHYSGDVGVTVETILKGAPAKQLVVKLGGSDCDGVLEPDRRTLVFLNADGSLTEGYDGVLDVRDGTWPAVLAEWAKTTDRAALLVDRVAAGGPIADDAARALTEHPDVLAALTAAQIDTLVKLVPKSTMSELPLALARVHAPGLVAALAKHGSLWAHEARQIAPLTDFEAITDTAALADAIAKADKQHAVAAFDRCERVRGKRLDYAFQLYMRGGSWLTDYWTRAALACRTGQPITY